MSSPDIYARAFQKDITRKRLHDSAFPKDLKDSAETVNMAADKIRAAGVKVDVPEIIVRPDILEWRGYSDGGDMWAIHPTGYNERLEVKKRNLKFTSAADFPYETIIVDISRTFEDALEGGNTPFAYFFSNQDHSAWVAVLGASHPLWKKTAMWDRKKHRKREFLLAPRSCIIPFEQAVELLVTRMKRTY